MIKQLIDVQLNNPQNTHSENGKNRIVSQIPCTDTPNWHS